MKKAFGILLIIILLVITAIFSLKLYNEKKYHTINIGFAIDDSYIEPLLVELYSLYSSKKGNYHINYYILSDKMTDKGKERVSKFIHEQNDNVQYIEIDSDSILRDVSLKAEVDHTLSHITRICFTRLIIDKILPKNLNRILFLDADLLIFEDIRNLYITNLGGKVAAMAYDIYGEGHIKGHREDDGVFSEWILNTFNIKHYYNGGIMLINLKKWRDMHISNDMIKLFYTYKDNNNVSYFYFNEQDVLNVGLGNKIKSLPISWNLHMEKLYEKGYEESLKDNLYVYIGKRNIYHYLGPFKPWNKVFRENYPPFWSHYEQKETYNLYIKYQKEFLDYEKKRIKEPIKNTKSFNKRFIEKCKEPFSILIPMTFIRDNFPNIYGKL